MPKGGVLPLTIKDKEALYSAYMPYVIGGGMFIPTVKRYALGDEVFLLLRMMDNSDKLPVPGRVIWITPEGS
ncbi:MAG TPA: pilus assembly protein PilZ, partial [Gammaproteobacteria bacterium]|nr:pilus assembly protein PilZ [Gammaproteobacteria bacterium]